MQKEQTNIRPATESDIPNLVLMGRSFFAQSGFANTPLYCDPYHLHSFLQQAIASDAHAVFVAEMDGLVRGTIAGVSSPAFYCPQLIANELFWWMEPSARLGRSALQLLDALEQWAKSKGCAVLAMVDIALMDSPAPRIYQRKGYQLAERSWIKTFEE